MAVLTERPTAADRSPSVPTTRKTADETAAPADDDQLLLAVASGDEKAYAALVHRHADRIYGYLLRLTRSAQDAEDLLQDTFFRVWRRARSYQPNRVQASTWIARIAHNACIDSFRKLRSSDGVALDTLDTAMPEQLTSVELETAQIASDALTNVEIQIGRLPENQRAALVLCQLQGFSNADAAHILGIKVRALESLLARARRTLRQGLAQGDNND